MIIDWFTVIAQVINFLILVWLLKRFLYKPILLAIATREHRIAAELAQANATKLAAQQQRDEYAQKNEVFDQARAEMMNKAMDEAKVERQRFIDTARVESATLRSQWQEALRNEHQNLNAEITRRTQDEVFAIARKVLGDLAGETLESRMVALFVQRLQQLSEEQRAPLLSAFKATSSAALVRTAYTLPTERHAEIEVAVQAAFGLTQQLQFEVAPNLVSGIELSTNGQKLAWSITEYLGALEKSVGELLHEQLKSTPVVNEMNSDER
jgi:F-type H+-transporting ATPase subunit b